MGVWLLLPEHLRLGTWDLLQGWTGQTTSAVEPRLALQLVHEAALCLPGLRQSRNLSQKGFELANGLPFVASDLAMHQLLDAHTITEAQTLQIALGKLRLASGHYAGRLLAIDPHHLRSYSKRQIRRHRHKSTEAAVKTAQSYFCLDTDTHQPLAFTLASAARTVSQGAPELLRLVQAILQPAPGTTLVLADKEHFSGELFEHVLRHTPFDLVAPMLQTAALRKAQQALPDHLFRQHWTGLSTATLPFQFQRPGSPRLCQIIQRCGEGRDLQFGSFLATRERDELKLLIEDYPQRWHVEEFFRADQALGWNRAGTLNLHIRYGQMTMALLAQAALHQLRQRLGPPVAGWDATHLAHSLLRGLDGDLRVQGDTIIVTCYNAPNVDRLRKHYEHLPEKLRREHVNPHIPWLYDFKLDFRFK